MSQFVRNGGALGLLVVASSFALADPTGPEKIFTEGNLKEGEQTLIKHLREKPGDDHARFGLGVIQFLRSFENLAANIYQCGPRTDARIRFLMPRIGAVEVRNPNPQVVDHKKLDEIVHQFLKDVNKAEATLALIQDANVKLRLNVPEIRLDLVGVGESISAARIFNSAGGDIPPEFQKLEIAFDRGDVSWFRGYCHFLAAGTEIILAVDGKEFFDATAHRLFEKVKTPHPFFNEEEIKDGFRFHDIADLIAAIHLLRFPVREPERLKSSLNHLEQMIAMSRDSWKHYLAETDDDHEFLPNPRQTSAFGVKVDEGMMVTWKQMVDEWELVLQGKRLVPFWRGENGKLGVNVRKVFTNPPKVLDPILWIQGSHATPYLERGVFTDFADRNRLQRIDRAFGGNFFGFALWFN